MRSEMKASAEEYIRTKTRDKPYARFFKNVKIWFINNTRSGSTFRSPDETTSKLLEQIVQDAQSNPSASDAIPLRWLPFAQGVQDQAVGEDHKPVLTVEEVTCKANQLCGIPSEEVRAMLRFHHDLGLLLHYQHIASLCERVIIDVQWLIKLTSALLHPLTTGDRNFEEQFQLLHDHGILLESLAVHIWSVRCPDEAAHLSSPEQRAFVLHLYESFAMLYDTGKTMVPPGSDTPSRAWLCPPLVRKLGEAVSSLSATSKQHAVRSPPVGSPPVGSPPVGSPPAVRSPSSNTIHKSPRIYLICREGRLFLHIQFWRLMVEFLCFFCQADSLSSQLQVEGTRMPSIFHRSARLPCDAVFPGYHLCITYFNKGLELVVLREEAAVKAYEATGGMVHAMEIVCSTILVFAEQKLDELHLGDGIAKPVWRRKGRCRCPQSSECCAEHGRRDCLSPGCHHFVNLADTIPYCPLGEHPAQDEVVQEVYPVWIKVRECGNFFGDIDLFLLAFGFS